MYRRRWSSFRIIGATRTIYVLWAPYLVLGLLRNGVYDALAILPLAVIGGWWADATGGSVGVAASDTRADGYGRFILDHGIASYFSILIAILVCLVVLRTGRRVEVRGLPYRTSIAQPVDLASVLFFVALAAVALYFGPGSWLHRLIPLVVAAGWAWFVRVHIYGRQRLWLPTEAGFRPPLRMMLTRRGRSALRACADASAAQTMTAAHEAYQAAASHPGGGETAVWHAYCLGREIEHAVARNQFAHAERLLRDAAPSGITSDDVVVAARGQFEFAVGGFDDARAQYEAAGAHRWRVPFRLRALRLQAAQAAAPRDEMAAGDWTWWARTSLVWNRRYTIVVVNLLRMVERIRGQDPQLALLLADRVRDLIEVLGATFSLSDLDPNEARQLQLAIARLHRQTADILIDIRRPRAAAGRYLASADLYRQMGHRPGRGETQVLAGVTALRLGPEGSAQEGQLLDLVLHGLVELEADRGALRNRDRRWAMLTTHDALYGVVLATLYTTVWHRNRAAELALWLMESSRRNALSEAIRQRLSHGDDRLAECVRALQIQEAQYQAIEPHQLGRSAPSAAPVPDGLAGARRDVSQEISDELSEAITPTPVDLAAVHDRLSGRISLYYACHAVGMGLQITAVLTTPMGTEMYQAVLDASVGCPRCADPPSFRPSTPSHLIQQLNCHTTGHSTEALALLPLRSRVWRDLAETLLPPGLVDALRQQPGPYDSVPVLVIVPDTLLSTVPFAGLQPIPGAALIDLATVVFQPNLAQVADADPPPVTATIPATRPTTIVTHLGPTDFEQAFRTVKRPANQVRLIPTFDQQALIDTLTRLGRAGTDLAVISSHGDLGDQPYDQFIYLLDGRVLSAMNAATIPWPQTVILGSCWSAHLPKQRHGEPFGLATACLYGGATSVVGGLAPVANRPGSARILAELSLAVADGVHPATALRECVTARRRLDRDPWPPAYEWAVLAVWTTRPPAPPATDWPSQPRQFWISHAVLGTPEAMDSHQIQPALPDDLIPERRYCVALRNRPVTEAVIRSLSLATARCGHHAPTTLDLFTAIVTAEPTTWNPYLRKLRCGAPPWDGRPPSGPLTDLDVGAGRTFAVSPHVAKAFLLAEQLTQNRGDAAVDTIHVVCVLLQDTDSIAFTWVKSHYRAPGDVIAQLIEAAGWNSRPTLLPLDDDRTDQPWTVTPETPGRDPVSSALLRRAVAIGFSRSEEGVLTTRAFLSGTAEADPRTWSTLAIGSPQEAEPGVERNHGGVEVGLGDDDYYVTATEEFAKALDTGRRLAAHLGHRQLTPAHVIYGVLSEPATDGSHWLHRHTPNGEDPRRRLADRIFGQPLPAADSLKPAAWGTSGAELLTIAGDLVLLGAYFGGKKLLRFATSVSLLIILSLTASLHHAYGAPETAHELVAAEAELVGTITIADQSIPAALVGRLGDYRVMAAIPGLVDQVREIVKDDTPATLAGAYLFLVSAAGLPRGIDTPASMAYRGSTYSANLTCAGAIAAHACLAVVRLPDGKAPAVTWKKLWIRPPTPGPLSEKAMVLGVEGGQIVTADLAGFTPAGATSDDPPLVRVRAQPDSPPVRTITPVVLAGHNRELPLFGFAIDISTTDWQILLPNDLITLYAQGLAGRLGGAPPGAVAFAGLRVTPAPGADGQSSGAVITEIQYGRPADFAGLRVGDIVLSMNGTPIHSQDNLTSVVQTHRPGDILTVRVQRDRAHHTAAVTLSYRTTR